MGATGQGGGEMVSEEDFFSDFHRLHMQEEEQTKLKNKKGEKITTFMHSAHFLGLKPGQNRDQDFSF